MSLLQKASAFCVYQERTQNEVREKLKSLKANLDEIEEIISWLITENFINEGRYAKQFAGGKFRIKKWGRRKIVYELKSRGLSANCISEGLAEINEEDYYNTITDLALKKYADLKAELTPLEKNQKVRLYLINKGYEPGLVTEVCKGILS